MKPNIGSLDRSIRIVVGAIILSLIIVGPETQWGWLGLVPMITAFVRFCPIYAALGVRTCMMFGVDTCSID
ncbi:MAG: DUF2892 domain-containing protein [Magnetococcales bacterium]|nr:DUF2892 domain-containing protein [Magnetococcales bacterium]